jgi:hypothetical protein
MKAKEERESSEEREKRKRSCCKVGEKNKGMERRKARNRSKKVRKRRK